jgi:hypothetical protein
MASKLFAHLRRQWMGALALFLVLSGGSAYALAGHNTVFSDDIVNGQVKGRDVDESSLAAIFQRRLSESCNLGRAISKVNSDGGVACSPSSVLPISLTPGEGSSQFTSLDPSNISLVANCGSPSGSFVRFGNIGPGAATLNWMFSEGTSSSTTVNASGNVIASGDVLTFNYSGSGRLEGQWIFSDAEAITTVHLHAFKGADFCEVRGTALWAAIS